MNISILFCPLAAATPAENELQSPLLPACNHQLQELTHLILELQCNASENSPQNCKPILIIILNCFLLAISARALLLPAPLWSPLLVFLCSRCSELRPILLGTKHTHSKTISLSYQSSPRTYLIEQLDTGTGCPGRRWRCS